MTRIVLVDDHRVLREGLKRSLAELDVEVVGEAGDAVSALKVLSKCTPDVAVVDISLPGIDGVELTRRIREEHPDLPVVVLTMFADGETLSQALRAGAVGYLVKDCSTEEIASLVEAVAAGSTDISQGLAQRLLSADRHSKGPLLSPREVEVLQLLAEGASTVAVARKLYISSKTVKNHLANIYAKMDTPDRTQAVLQGLKLGIVRLR